MQRRQKRLTLAQARLLHMLATHEGHNVSKVIKQSPVPVAWGAVYVMIERFVETGLVTKEIAPNDGQRGNPRGFSFVTVTPLGRQALLEWKLEMIQFFELTLLTEGADRG